MCELISPRVLIVDDHALILDAVSLFLKSECGLIVETAKSIPEACEILRRQGRFEAVLLDYNLPDNDFIAGLRRVIKLNDGRVTVFSGAISWDEAEKAIASGADGIIPKTLPLKEFGDAVYFIVNGGGTAPDAQLPARSSALEEQELRVLRQMGRGMRNAEIAVELRLEEITVDRCVNAIFTKLGALNRCEAVIAGHELGLLSMEER